MSSLPSIGVDALCNEIDLAFRAEPQGYLATDADGTLWSGDVGEDFFHAMVELGDVREEAQRYLARAASGAKLSSQSTGALLARDLFRAYEEGHFPEDACCEMIAALSAGWTIDEATTFSNELAQSRALLGRAHLELQQVLRWAVTRGIDIAVVSASPRTIVEAGVRALGLAPKAIIAVTPRVISGASSSLLASESEQPIPYGDGKVTNLLATMGKRPLLAAFGDNAFDVPMLRHAQLPLAVRPKERLRARAGEVPSLRILAES